MGGYAPDALNPSILVPAGLAGVILGGILLMTFVLRRLGRLFRRRTVKAPRKSMIFGLRNLILVFLLLAVSGTALFAGLFFRAYHRFSHDTPVAEIDTRPLNRSEAAPVAQVRYHPTGNGPSRYFLIHGDQWMIEGDIIKWKPWLNLLGLAPRYRLTRIRGRYLDIAAERSAPRSMVSLIADPCPEAERHPVWRFLYRSGQRLPLVDTVYGNAAYQDLSPPGRYQVFVGATGFIIRKKGEIDAAKIRE